MLSCINRWVRATLSYVPILYTYHNSFMPSCKKLLINNVGRGENAGNTL